MSSAEGSVISPEQTRREAKITALLAPYAPLLTKPVDEDEETPAAAGR